TGVAGAAIVLSATIQVLSPRDGGAGSEDSSLNSIRPASPGFASPVTNSSSRVSAAQLYDVPSSSPPSLEHAPRPRTRPRPRPRPRTGTSGIEDGRIRLLRDEVGTGYPSTRARWAPDR